MSQTVKKISNKIHRIELEHIYFDSTDQYGEPIRHRTNDTGGLGRYGSSKFKSKKAFLRHADECVNWEPGTDMNEII